MAQRKLQNVLATFERSLYESRRLATDAQRWSSPTKRAKGPHISMKRRDSMTELAFLRGFLAWETFLEESFVLYLLGQVPPHGSGPKRYVFPPSHRAATEWIVPEGRRYARWTVAAEVSERAERIFEHGRPFAPVLRSHQHTLDEARTIRNAIAHESSSAGANFDTLVRNKLGALPPGLRIGGFLAATVPTSAPPMSFLESYLQIVEFAAQRIIPV